MKEYALVPLEVWEDYVNVADNIAEIIKQETATIEARYINHIQCLEDELLKMRERLALYKEAINSTNRKWQ